ncbi:hypothetical protein [Parasitella parasitica]|uniref:VASt domain-containing protein n=1 Tax=Parasitella parasitica TaxID=35722 RepID=A0A0B7MV35_9FUNG|nr:hypothetical protein [Parasitella parasitica]
MIGLSNGNYGCALQKEILLQGRVYISEHHLCFNANIFGWITNLVIAFADIEDIEKKSTAIFIPNAILISTCSSKHFLASFLSRDQAYDQMVEVWKASRACKSAIEVHESGLKDDDATEFSGSDESDYTSSDYSYSDQEEDDDELNADLVTASSQINDKHINSALDERQASLASLPIPKHLSSADEAARRRAVSEAGPRPNMQEYIKKSTESTAGSATAGSATATTAAANANENSTTEADTSILPTSAENAIEKKDVQIKATTECECSKNEQHFPTVVLDSKYDTTIETIAQANVCIGEWSKNDACVHSRESSYVKYLGGSIGPKSTKCYLKEQVLHLDTADYVSQLTVTQTPDVPSGGSFSVKTRTCISWCGQGQVRVLVTVLVDFTKSSWLKSTIEKASIDGQQNFYKSLDAAVRKYLDSHAGDTRRSANSGKKKGGKRRHRHRNHAEKDSAQEPSTVAAVPAPTADADKQHFIIQILSGILDWIIEYASLPNTSQLTAICMTIMVITNFYIASKMAGVDRQLSQLQNHKRHGSEFYQHHIEISDDDNSLWRLLSRLDPDARKEDAHFTHQVRQPLSSDPVNHSNNDDISDEQLHFSRLAKQKLDKQMAELERMIQKAGQSMQQVTHAVQYQRQRISDPDLM